MESAKGVCLFKGFVPLGLMLRLLVGETEWLLSENWTRAFSFPRTGDLADLLLDLMVNLGLESDFLLDLSL
jgi:hypothetical protein